jgi:hypothetical protein
MPASEQHAALRHGHDEGLYHIQPLVGHVHRWRARAVEHTVVAVLLDQPLDAINIDAADRVAGLRAKPHVPVVPKAWRDGDGRVLPAACVMRISVTLLVTRIVNY